MNEPTIRATNEPLMHAVIALAARCAECASRPTARAARAIAKELARERRLDSRDRDALLEAAENFAAPLEAPLESSLDSHDRSALLEVAESFAATPEAPRENELDSCDEEIASIRQRTMLIVSPGAFKGFAAVLGEPLQDDLPAHQRVRRWARAAVVAAVAAAVIVVVVLSRRSGESNYGTAVREAGDAMAVVVYEREDGDAMAVVAYEREYARTQDPRTGVKLANSLRRGEKLQEATALANSLLTTSVRSDALQVLGKIAIKEEHFDAGRTALESARELHVVEQRFREMAVDDQALAGIYNRQKRFAEALRALDACITESQVANEHVLEGYCHMSAGTVLGELGYFASAQQELAQAESLLVTDRDLAQLAIARGRLDQRYGLEPLRRSHHAEAVLEFTRASQYASVAALPQVKRQAELNLVDSLIELGRTDEASWHLEIARRLDLDGKDVNDRALLEARIAYRRGDFALATSINTRTYDELIDDDDHLRVCVMQAQIGLATGDLEGTTTWARRGVEVVERMRGAQSEFELRSWILSMRQQPYELLFTALARQHRFDDALTVFDQWQGRTLFDAMAREQRAQPSSLRDTAMHIARLNHLLPVLSNVPLMKAVDSDVLVAALRGVELVALVVANEEVWRITARHGRLDMTDLGNIATLQPLLDQFEATPTRVELADALGTKLLGEATFRATSEALFVVLDGPIAGLPIAALRARRLPLVAMRPVVRAARLSELGCVPAPSGPRHAVILADARGDLPAARREADELASVFGVRPAVGADATRDALFATSRDDVLHVATHADVGRLDLYDQPVSALEISARGGGPALVVLSADATAADDSELATSLATAFLASGSPQVIAVLHSVTDLGASELTSGFYRTNGVADPARSLARIQAALAQTSNVDWPNFVLFGHDICRKESP